MHKYYITLIMKLIFKKYYHILCIHTHIFSSCFILFCMSLHRFLPTSSKWPIFLRWSKFQRINCRRVWYHKEKIHSHKFQVEGMGFQLPWFLKFQALYYVHIFSSCSILVCMVVDMILAASSKDSHLSSVLIAGVLRLPLSMPHDGPGVVCWGALHTGVDVNLPSPNGMPGLFRNWKE